MKLSKLFKNTKTARHILNNVMSKSGQMISTDIETMVIGPSNLEDGIYKIDTLDVLPQVFERFSCDDFPQYFDDTYTACVTFSKAELNDLIAHASKDKTRPYLCGVFVGNGEVVATNGHIMRIIKRVVNSEVVLNVNTLKKIESIMKKKDTAFIEIGADFFQCKLGDIKVIGRLVKREYPKYQEVLPSLKKLVTTFKINILPDFKKLKPLLDSNLRVTVKSNGNKLCLYIPNTEYYKEIGICEGAVDFDVNLKYLIDNNLTALNYAFFNDLAPICQFEQSHIVGVLMPIKK